MSKSLLVECLKLFESGGNTQGRSDKIKFQRVKNKKKRSKERKQKGLTVAEAQQILRNNKDRTDKNIQYLQLLSKCSVEEDIAKNVLKRAGRMERDEAKVKPVEEGTGFTEEDFEKFEKEYFVTD